METKEILEGGTIREILFNSDNEKKAFLLVDDDLKRIWTYNSEKCSFTLQIYGNILAHMLSRQLRLFYRVSPLNIYTKNDQKFQEILDKPILHRFVISNDLSSRELGDGILALPAVQFLT